MSERSYESAVARIEQIVRSLETGGCGLRDTLALVAEGRELVVFCDGELAAVSAGLQELALDELIAGLEARAAAD